MRRVTALAVTSLLALSVASCGLPGTGSADPPPASQPPPVTVTASAPGTPTDAPSATGSASDLPASTEPTPTEATPADPDQPGAGDQLGRVVAVRTGLVGRAKTTMKLYPLQRDGATSHLNFSLASPVDSVQGQVGQTLSDSNFSAIDKTGDTADGLQLVDGKHAKLYLVASDGRGQCVCSRGLSNVFLRDNVPTVFSATFAAPPADVAQVDVRIPGYGTVKNVPVQ
jgi:hypothetical protein